MSDLRATYLTATYQSNDNRQFDVPICVKDGQPRLHFPSGAIYEITKEFNFSDIGTARLVAYNLRAGVQITQQNGQAALDRMVFDLKLPAIPPAPAPITAPVTLEPPKARNLQEAKILNEQAALARLTAQQSQSRIIMENPTPSPRQQALNNMMAANREQISQQHRDRDKVRGR